MDFDPEKDMQCPCCGDAKAKTLFYKRLNGDGVYPYCKVCINANMDRVNKNVGSESVALWSVCSMMDIPLIRKAYDATMSKAKASNTTVKNLFGVYYSTLKEMCIPFGGNYDTDIDMSNFINVTPPDELEEKRKEWDKIWGSAYNNEQCERLDEYYDAYTQDILSIDTAQMLRFRDLAKAELRKFEGDDSKETTDEILKLMKLLKIDQFKDVVVDEREKFIDRLIWKIENTEPAEEEDVNKYKDVNGFEIAFDNIMRSMRNIILGEKAYPEVPKEEV